MKAGSLTLLCLFLLALEAFPALAQLSDESSFSAPSYSPGQNPLERLDDEAFSGSKTLNPNLRNYSEIQLRQILPELSLPEPAGGYDWPRYARTFVRDPGVIITAAAPAVTVQVDSVKPLLFRTEIVITVLDRQGKVVTYPEIMSYNLDLKPLRFRVDRRYIGEEPVGYYFAIDTRKNMVPHREALEAAVIEFAEKLPGKKKCDFTFVGNANLNTTRTVNTGPDESSCNAKVIRDMFREATFGNEGDLYGGILSVNYSMVGNFPKIERGLVFIFTDGAQGSSQISKKSLIAGRKTYNIAYWIGDIQRQNLEGMIDFEAVAGLENTDAFLDSVFSHFTDQIAITVYP